MKVLMRQCKCGTSHKSWVKECSMCKLALPPAQGMLEKIALDLEEILGDKKNIALEGGNWLSRLHETDSEAELITDLIIDATGWSEDGVDYPWPIMVESLSNIVTGLLRRNQPYSKDVYSMMGSLMDNPDSPASGWKDLWMDDASKEEWLRYVKDVREDLRLHYRDMWYGDTEKKFYDAWQYRKLNHDDEDQAEEEVYSMLVGNW